jgi:hypothetical protein
LNKIACSKPAIGFFFQETARLKQQCESSEGEIFFKKPEDGFSKGLNPLRKETIK